ncbi:glutamate receptor 1.2-like [Herrania umbratica]|uniref:Glutamate receptor n=1 Tax=Herrania umbratica TaxID=108875 RepID=A0A6J0ZK04_9ROSI|nr:glutamate receptor 1.2-like [Herrania umbratica]
MKRKNQILLLFVIICLTSCLENLSAKPVLTKKRGNEMDYEVHVGVILDMGSLEGKILQRCISMAISDFYSGHHYYKTRLVLHTRDSKGETLNALSAALNLLEDAKVGAILGPQTSLEAKFLAEFGDKYKIPVISFSTPGSFPTTTRSPYFVQIAHDQNSEVKGIAALIELYKWRNVILIHEENDDLNLDNTISFMAAFFEEKNIRIAFMSAIAASSEDDQIIEQLHELRTLQTAVFIVHLSHFLTSRLFINAKRLGMISEGYAWIVTSKGMNHLHLRDSSIVESMQGVLGFRSYIPASEELHNFTSRLRTKLFTEGPHAIQDMQLNILGSLAYDVAWSLKTAAERVAVKVSFNSNLDARSNSMDLDIYRTSMYGSILLQEIQRSNFKGLSGEFRFINGKLISNAFEIVNVLSNGEKRVGFCTSTGKITREIYESNHRRQLSFTNNLESIIWPGGSSTIPQGRMLQTSGKILRIGVPSQVGYPQLLEQKHDPRINATTFTGFCIDVFKAAIEGLDYQLPYQFIPFEDPNGKSAGTYNELIYQVYLREFDAVIGDTTITANRSLYADFTTPYTDIGVGIVAPTENKDMWIFFKPLTPQLWLTIVGFHIITGFLIWLIECQSPRHGAEGLPPQRSGFPFSILVGRWEQLRNNWSTFLAVVSLFVMFILSSSYTATLASMMTVQHIELNSKGSYIGYHATSNITKGVLISNLNFEDNTLKPFSSIEQFADALSKGSKNGGVSAILDEITYIKIFLAEYSADYSLIKTFSITNGFGFVFPKGSPLVPDISREIARLRESGRLNMLENTWFKSKASLTSGDSVDNVRPLTPTNFGGLFLISGILSVVAFLIFQIPLLNEYWHAVRNRMINPINVWRQVHRFGKEYFLSDIVRRIRTVNSAATHPQVQMI